LTHDRESFRSSYAGSPPWDIGKPQPAFQAAAILNAAFPDRDYGRVARYPDTISPARMGFQLTCRDNVSSLPPILLVAYCSIQLTTCCSVKTLRCAEGLLALLSLQIKRSPQLFPCPKMFDLL